MAERFKTSIHANLVFYLIVGSIGFFGLVLLIMLNKIRRGGVLGFAMACSNTFGLVTRVFLLCFGLSEIPKGLWRNADWTTRQKVLSHKIAKMAVKLDDVHQELSNAIVVTFYRICSAFAFGAKKLARLLDCPKEDLRYEVNQFFMNTWDRHGSGQHPDAPKKIYGKSKSVL